MNGQHSNGHASNVQHTNGLPVSKRRRIAPNWKVQASRESVDCVNPVRSCDEIYFKDAKELRDKSKDLIALSIGDPAKSTELPPHPAVNEAVKLVLDGGKHHGYANSSGLREAKEAVAKEYSRPNAVIAPENVILANAISGALEMSCAVLSNPGQNILLPTPGFGLYKCHAEARGVQVRLYSLLPDREWEIDLVDLEKQIDENTAAMVIVNPSNPCGSVYTGKHIKDILTVAERHQVPIIADETYDGMVFTGKEFVAMASLSENVPILSCGGISKKYMVPGWRLGWILIHDRNGAFKDEVIPGLHRLAMKLLGPCTLTQAALPYIFENVPESYHQRNLDLFESNATICYKALKDVPGITPVMPAGAMYMMVTIDLDKFPDLEDDIAFTKRLLIEQSVFCLPGKAFLTTGCFRICLIMHGDVITTACQRIVQFCKDHLR